MFDRGKWPLRLKRAIDIAVSATTLLFLLPFIAVVALLVRLSVGSPVFFIQDRPGLDGEIFKLYKFRSMRDTHGPDGKLLADHERISKFGRLLRKLSIDELPQLVNVLKGDMSLVGPRPLLVDYLDRYTPEQARRHDVRPGITGLAQINGRNTLPWEEKFQLDLYYVDHRTTALDVKIMMKTVIKLIRPDGRVISTNMFMGNTAEASNENESRVKKVA